MKCPKCGFEQPESPECIHCGIIVAKYLQKQTPPQQHEDTPAPAYPRSAHPKIKKLFQVILLMCIIVFGVSYFKKDGLPDKSAILNELYREPEQEKCDLEPFTVTTGGISYSITPLYTYRLFGLVVSCHDSTAWWDITHRKWQDYLNIKDLCVLWGENILTGAYRHIRFSSGMLTCYAQSNDEEAWSQFSMKCLANNHLLSESSELNELIMSTRTGDQIYMDGYLVNYARTDSQFKRNTSTARNDLGDGACEVVYVEDFRILKKANTLWRFLFSASAWGAALCCGVMLAVFIVEPLHAT